jgi:hypothetical protein
MRPNTVATNIFEAGPAIDISISPTLLFFTLYGFHSIGFAQPKVKPVNEVKVKLIHLVDLIL